MAYSADGKVYTEHALMDNIVHEVKKIFKSIIIKNDMLANLKETEKSIENYEIAKMLANDTLTFGNFPYNEDYLRAYGFTSKQIENYLEDRNRIPVTQREDLLNFCIRYYNATFEETNDYYRTLIGLPPYGTETQYWITYEGTYNKPGYGDVIPDYYKNAEYIDIDTTLPLHQQTKFIIDAIQNNQGIEQLRSYYKGSNYSYIQFLGNKAIDLYTARSAAKYDILYMPKVERLVKERFEELYYLNREVYLKRTYQSAYIYESDYYEQIMIIMILCQTFSDIITEVPEWYIRRDIFDLRSVKYFLDSYSVEFFPEIPLKYQVRIVKNLNELIKYKSSNRNNYDIVDIFDLDDVKIYKYYLYKRQRKKGEKYIHSSTNNKNYDLQFIRSEISDTYDNYIKNNLYIEDYDNITLEDKYWDAELNHDTIKREILKKDFTIEGTKYMSIEYIAPQGDYQEQISYFVGSLLNSHMNLNDVTVMIPSISETTELRISDLFLMLMALTDIYDGKEQTIRFPEEPDVYDWELPFDDDYDRIFKIIDGGLASSTDADFETFIEGKVNPKEPTIFHLPGDGGEVEHNPRVLEEFNNWTKYWYRPMYTKENTIDPWMHKHHNNRINGFNDVNLEILSVIIGQRHSRFGFLRGYTLEDLGIENYISPSDAEIHSPDDFIAFYHNNMAIYQSLKLRMTGRYFKYGEKPEEIINAKDYDEYKVLEFVFNTLFTREFDYQFYTLIDGSYATSYADILLERNYLLYNIYQNIKTSSDTESQRSNIRDLVNDIVNTLEYYLSGDGLEYIFAFTATASFEALLRYVYLMINFFKSWKVHFIDPFVTFRVNDYLQNSSGVMDGIRQMTDIFDTRDKSNINDVISTFTDVYEVEDYTNNHVDAEIRETLGISWYYDPDPYDDYIYDGLSPKEEEGEYKIADGRFPNDASQWPYIVLDARGPRQGKFGDWVLDGGTPMDEEYEALIDGKTPYEENDRHDYMGTLGFNYVVDGGPVSYSDHINRTMRLDLHNHQVYADVRISEKAYNVLKKGDDGLYIIDEWVDLTEFKNFVDSISDDFRIYHDIYEVLLAIIEDLIDMDALDQTLAEIREKYVGTMEEVLDELKDDNAKEQIEEYTNQLVDKLIEDYSQFTALGTWNSLDPVPES